MSIFTTEFPISPGMSDAQFVAIVENWISGIEASTLDSSIKDEEDSDTVFVLSEDGKEQLELRRYAIRNNVSAIGARYIIEKDDALKFIIDTILKRDGSVDWISVKARTETLRPGALAPTPRKPAIIKCIFDRGYGGEGQSEFASIRPLHLNEADMEVAVDLFAKGDPSGLAFVYLSRSDEDKVAVDPDKMANDLAGLANVYVEPSRSFSFKLAERVGGNNPYAGAVGLWLPNSEERQLFFLRGRVLVDEIREILIGRLASRSLEHGLDWAGLLEGQTRKLRLRITGDPSVEKMPEAFKKVQESLIVTIEEKDRQLSELREKLLAFERNASSPSALQVAESSFRKSSLNRLLYPGELSDRVALALRSISENNQLDERTKAVALTYSSFVVNSAGAENIKSRIKSCSESPARMKGLMKELGFEHSEDGKHHKFRPVKSLAGAQQFTMSKSSSDVRASKNLTAEVLGCLGLKGLI